MLHLALGMRNEERQALNYRSGEARGGVRGGKT